MTVSQCIGRVPGRPARKLGQLLALLGLLPLTACLSTVDGTPQEQLPEPVRSTTRAQLCAGSTPVGATAWQVDRDDVVHVDIDTSHCGMSGAPLYFTSLGGEGSHWAARGTTSIYRASASQFRVVLLRADAGNLADSASWHVNWLARPSDVVTPHLCTGRTQPEDFQQYEDGGVSVAVDLRACGFSEPPVLLTSLGGVEGHAATRGATSVYGVEPGRFRVFIQKPGITVEQAIRWGWHVNWSASPPSNDNGAFCTGTTRGSPPLWQQYGQNGLAARLQTDDCAAPLVFATISGEASHWYTTGASSIYDSDATGFRVFINRSRVTPEFAAERGWNIHWTRVTPTAPSGE